MPDNTSKPLTTEDAVMRARLIIEAAQTITRPADPSEPRIRGARAFKDHMRLTYRTFTVPNELQPILEALIRAASDEEAAPEESGHVTS